MQATRSDNAGALSIGQMQNTAINFVEVLTSVIALPVETLLRPWYGTRFYSPPVVFFASALMILLPAVSALFSGVMGLIPFVHAAPALGLFDIGSLAKLYFMLAIVHGVRLYRLMIAMSKESCSTFEGPPLPVFQWLPWGQNFWLLRIAIEPATVLIASVVLQDLFIIQSDLAIYLRLAAVALVMKNFVSWFKSWEYLRDLLDARNIGPIIAKLVENNASEDELSTIHLAGFPADVPDDIRKQAAINIARAYTPER